MWHVGIDLHRQSLMVAAVDDEGNARAARRIDCQDRQTILETMSSLQPEAPKLAVISPKCRRRRPRKKAVFASDADNPIWWE